LAINLKIEITFFEIICRGFKKNKNNLPDSAFLGAGLATSGLAEVGTSD
jgi:hypothetical protein